MNEEKNKNMELNTEDLDAVSGGKIYHYPEKTESSVARTQEISREKVVRIVV